METAYRSIFDCARRETFEETGLDVKLLRIVYIREFIDEDSIMSLINALSLQNYEAETLATIPKEDDRWEKLKNYSA